MATLRRFIKSRREQEKLQDTPSIQIRNFGGDNDYLYFNDADGKASRYSLEITRAELERMRDTLDAYLGAKDEPEYSPNGIPGIDFNP